MLRDFWRLARPFWVSDERWKARGLLLVVSVLTVLNVGILLLFNVLNGELFNAFQTYDIKLFWQNTLKYTVVVFVYVFSYVYQSYLQQLLGVRWRQWLTDDLLRRWLTDRSFYYWQIRGDHVTVDNPDQRIAEDVRDLINATLYLGFGLLQQTLTVIVFTKLLWSLSGAARFTLGGIHFVVPGYMVWVALLYAVIGSVITYRIGRRLVDINFNQQRFEANFRFSLAHLRENAESIAVSHGESAEQSSILIRLTEVLTNTLRVIKKQKQVGYFTISYSQIASLFPFVVAAPRYFAHQINLGQLSQISNSFGQMQYALSFFVNAFTDNTNTNIAYWASVVRRLTTFGEAIEQAKILATEGPQFVEEPTADADRAIATQGLTVRRPDGATLLHDVALRLAPGRSVLLSGPSGTGKSTLLRALVGAWPYADGQITRPASFNVLILPQKPYLPIGTLRAALCYPSADRTDGERSDEQLRAALDAARLPQLADRLDDSENWSQILSPGEQQRVSFARAFLQRPDYVFLDEASSALDEPTEAHVYRALRDTLPDAALLSIGHRSTLVPLHDDHLTVTEGSVREPSAAHGTADNGRKVAAEVTA